MKQVVLQNLVDFADVDTDGSIEYDEFMRILESQARARAVGEARDATAGRACTSRRARPSRSESEGEDRSSDSRSVSGYIVFNPASRQAATVNR